MRASPFFRSMFLHGVLATVLLGTALTPAMAAPARAAPTKPGKADAARSKALLSFQHDLVSLLALRAEPMPLMAAALLARPLHGAQNTESFHNLIDRAARAPGAGPAATWLELADCNAQSGSCPNDKALQQLTTQASDNDAVWLLKLGQDVHRGDQDAARADLARAASAKLYDDYTGTSLKALAESVGMLPPPKAVLKANHGSGPYGVQFILVFGLGEGQPQPLLPATARFCANGDDAVKADCRKLAGVLEWGSSPLARSLGLHLRETLGTDAGDRAAARAARLNLIWQVQNFGQLSARALQDRAVAQPLLALAGKGGTQMSLILAALREQGISADAPVGWTPPQAAQG